MANDNDTELTIPIIVTEAEGFGIDSYDHGTPAEEAEALYNTCKTAYDNIDLQLKAASTQQKMNEFADEMYTTADTCLNQLWKLLKNNVPEDKYQEIRKEQRQWIDDKEAAAAKILEENDGTAAQLNASLDLATRTLDRCEILLTYIQANTQ